MGKKREEKEREPSTNQRRQGNRHRFVVEMAQGDKVRDGPPITAVCGKVAVRKKEERETSIKRPPEKRGTKRNAKSPSAKF